MGQQRSGRPVQTRRGQGEDLVSSGLVYIAVGRHLLAFYEQVAQLLHIANAGGNLDLRKRGGPVARLHQGRNFWGPRTGT